MMLLCLGMLREDGSLDVGAKSADHAIAALQSFFQALHLAWKTGSTVLIDA